MSTPVPLDSLTVGDVGRTVTYEAPRLTVTGVLESLEVRGRYAAIATPYRLRVSRAVVIQIDDVVIATSDPFAIITIHPQETPHV